MAYTLKAHSTGAGANNVTTNSVNTTGADLIVVVVSYLHSEAANIALTDSNSNSWTVAVTASDAAATAIDTRIYYSQAPTVGSGHTFNVNDTVTSPFTAVEVTAWSGSAASPLDQTNSNDIGGNATSGTTGSITPSVANELLIAAIVITTGTSESGITISSPFTISDSNDFVSGTNFGGAQAYLVQTTATTENPTWSWTGASDAAAAIASFKAAVATGLDVSAIAMCVSA